MDTLLPFERMKKDVLVRKEAKTSDKFGCIPEKRSAEVLLDYGIVAIDKPAGPSSHQVSAYVQHILNIEKSGHSGTLDPKVTGILPIGLGRGTKIVQALLNAGKEYICLMHLHKEIDEVLLRKTLESFVGKIRQLPPVKSAVKREFRYRKIYYIEIISILGKDVLFKVGSQAGTYIRKLVHDIGQQIGCGAHMAELRRTKAGPFTEDTLCTLQDLSDAYYYYTQENNDKYLRHLIKSIEFGASHLPHVWVLDSSVDSLCHGAILGTPGISKVQTDIQVGEVVALMTLKDELIALGTTKMITKEMIKSEKGAAVITQRVFMKPGTYPKMQKE